MSKRPDLKTVSVLSVLASVAFRILDNLGTIDTIRAAWADGQNYWVLRAMAAILGWEPLGNVLLVVSAFLLVWMFIQGRRPVAHRHIDPAEFRRLQEEQRQLDQQALKDLLDVRDHEPTPLERLLAGRWLSVKSERFQAARLSGPSEDRAQDLLCVTGALYLTNHTAQPLNLIPKIVIQVRGGVVPDDIIVREALPAALDDETRSRMPHGDMTGSQNLTYLGRVIHVPPNSTLEGYLAFVIEGALFDLVDLQKNDLWAAIRTANHTTVEFENRQTGQKVAVLIPGDSLNIPPSPLIALSNESVLKEWGKLEKRFAKLDTDARAASQSMNEPRAVVSAHKFDQDPKQDPADMWTIDSHDENCRKDAEALFANAGALLLHSKFTVQTEIKTLRSDRDRWLSFLMSLGEGGPTCVARWRVASYNESNAEDEVMAYVIRNAADASIRGAINCKARQMSEMKHG